MNSEVGRSVMKYLAVRPGSPLVHSFASQLGIPCRLVSTSPRLQIKGVAENGEDHAGGLGARACRVKCNVTALIMRYTLAFAGIAVKTPEHAQERMNTGRYAILANHPWFRCWNCHA